VRVVVTGASGFLGSASVAALAASGHDVLAVVRPSSDPWRLVPVMKSIAVVRANLQESGAYLDDFSNFRPEAAVHFAWQAVAAGERNDPKAMLSNIRGTLAFLETIASAGCRVFVGMGSQAEFGPVAGPLSETREPRPTTAYGTGKHAVRIAAEKYCELAGIRFVWLRLLAAYGPRDSEGHLIPTVIRALMRREKPLLTNGRQRWDYLHVDDAATAVEHSLRTGAVCGAFLLASGEAWTVRRIVEFLRDRIDPGLPLEFGGLRQPGGSRGLWTKSGETLRLKATGWRPKTPLEIGLAATVRSHPATSGARGPA
jgi:nucleoside-diphosphate-sugar epimerase